MRNFKKHIGLFSIIILVFIVAYTAYFINKNNIANQSFIVNKQDISFSSLPSNFNDYKILEIADLHSMKFGENNEKLISEIDKLSPDIIFVTGDMFSAYQFKKDDGTYNRDYNEESLPGFQLLKNLSQKYEIIYSTGNHEEGIDNNYTTISKNGQSINVYGIYYYFLDKFASGQISDDSPDLYFLNNVDDTKFNILLSHNPTGAQILQDKNFDLVLSGHVHGGIIRLFNKGLLDPARKLFPKYDKGLYQIGNTKLFVSVGLGNTKFMRINNTPELNLITLKTKNT